MMIAYAHGGCDCPGYPGQSAQSNDHVGGQHNVSENALLHSFLSNCKCDMECLACLCSVIHNLFVVLFGNIFYKEENFFLMYRSFNNVFFIFRL